MRLLWRMPEEFRRFGFERFREERVRPGTKAARSQCSRFLCSNEPKYLRADSRNHLSAYCHFHAAEFVVRAKAVA